MRIARRPHADQPQAAPQHADDGFTLVEMLVALGLITTALLALLGAFLTSAASVQQQQTRSKAVRVALDRNEALRLQAYDSADLSVGTHAGTATGPDGQRYAYTTQVVERDARPTDTVAGDVVKEIRTTVRWSGPRAGSVSYVTAVAADARDIGLPAGYQQTIRSMSITPDPSVIVTYDGYTTDDIIVTVVLTGHDVGDTVRISWTDDRGLQTRTATTTDARYWRYTLPAGAGGLSLRLSQNASRDLAFTATTSTGLSKTSTLKVFGPTASPPTITSFAVAPVPLDMINGGGSRYQNKNDVTFSCVVNGLQPTVSNDSVKATYVGETGATVQINLTRATSPAPTTTASTWTAFFPRSTTFFGIGVDQPYSCVVRRYLDGGAASKVTKVTVKK